MFLNTWAIGIGAAALALPIVIHLLTRPRPVRLPISTLRFVREALRDRRQRHRWRDFLILALRTLAVALIALAIARPQFGEQPLIADTQEGDALRVVILDQSQSMSAIGEEATSFQRGRTLAASHLRYRPGLRANLILAAAQSQAIFTEPSQNLEALREALSNAEITAERLDVNRAIGQAARMLTPREGNGQPRLELVVVSDFQRSNWAAADFSALPRQTKIQFESTAPASTADNLALLSAAIEGRAVVGKPATLAVEVGNYAATARKVAVEARLGETAYRLEGMCPAGRRTTLTEQLIPSASGWLTGQAQLRGNADALAADDATGIAVLVGDSPSYALLTRQRATERPSSSYFLECALVPEARRHAEAAGKVTRMHPADLDQQALAGSDLIVLDHVGRLSEETVTTLTGLLRRGRPILYVAAEGADAANLTLFDQALGGSLQLPVRFEALPAGSTVVDLFLTSYDAQAAPFQIFGDDLAAVAGPLRFASNLTSQRRENTLNDDILAQYSNGSACLVITSSSSGTLAVLNADLGRSNLPISSAFVPLIDQLTEQLLSVGGGQEAEVCGEPLVARLSAEAADADSLRVDLQSSAAAEAAAGAGEFGGEFANEGLGLAWRHPGLQLPGVYRVSNGSTTLHAVAVRIPAEEGNLEALPAEVLLTRLAGGRTTYFRAAEAPQQGRDYLWTWLAVACVLCLLAEVGALIGFRS